MTLSPRQRLIVALDFPKVEGAKSLVDALGDGAQFYKIGLELLFHGGSDLARELAERGLDVFFDAKLLDIGHTVERATANIALLGARFLTIHGTDRKTMSAAVKGRGTSDLKLLGVTVMTNLDTLDLVEQGIEYSPSEMVLRRARMAQECGMDGIVASGHEASILRRELGPDFLIVTPGIRPSGADSGDQSRVMTPGRAIAAGADYLVVGRPITQADDPHTAALAIVGEIAQAGA